MNDFSELENELKKLRPAQPSEDLAARIESALAEATSISTAGPTWRKFLTCDPAKATWKVAPLSFNWRSVGLGLAATAVLLLLARVGFQPSRKQSDHVASSSPPPTIGSIAKPVIRAGLIPAGATQVVYDTRDEGLHFAAGYDEPMRRVRYQTRETLQWRNPNTGASLRVSYPSEEVVLTPVSGQ